MNRLTDNLTAKILSAGAAGLLVALPLAGSWMAGQPLARYTEFPPLTQYVEHAGFSWPFFIFLSLIILGTILPFLFRLFSSLRTLPSALSIQHSTLASPSSPLPVPNSNTPKLPYADTPIPPHSAFSTPHSPPSILNSNTPTLPYSHTLFPLWGCTALILGIATWILAWTRFDWFAPLQQFTFTPLWLSYIIVVNALAFRRTGNCMMLHRPRFFLSLFPLSAAFWWFFEYLNRFVQNWHYVGIADLSALQYFVFATLPFSTVLPAVLGTCELLETFPSASAGMDSFVKIRISRPKTAAWITLAVFGAGFAFIGIYPDYLFPLLWVSPLFVIVSVQAILGKETIFSTVAEGNWRRIFLLAASSLICGFFWEMWNFLSVAKWVYSVPFVGEFKIFEMPVLGYAGYLPFGLECAVIPQIVSPSGSSESRRRMPKFLTAMLALAAAALLWMPCLHVFFKPRINDYLSETGAPRAVKEISAHHLELWLKPELRAAEIAKMRGSNAEWDFMGRTFLVLSLANMCLREPKRQDDYLQVMDQIIDETIRLEKEKGIYYFLMDYAREGKFVNRKKRSLFEDGEIALMIASRRLVMEKDEYKAPLLERVNLMAEYMQESPVLSGESYPDECWTFCNTVALAAIRISDLLDGTDHSAFLKAWVVKAKERLTDPASGLLISSYGFDGSHLDGPEGSTIWMVAHCLQVIDPEYAADQYRRARKELSESIFGFGYAREWPASWKGHADIDSGPIIPFLEMSAGSSGMALLGAASFNDRKYMESLLTSLNYGGFPVRKNGKLRFCASNQVGDSVLLYSLVQGPLWKETMRRLKKQVLGPVSLNAEQDSTTETQNLGDQGPSFTRNKPTDAALVSRSSLPLERECYFNCSMSLLAPRGRTSKRCNSVLGIDAFANLIGPSSQCLGASVVNLFPIPERSLK